MRNKLFTTALVSVLALLLVAGVGLAEPVAPPELSLDVPDVVERNVEDIFGTLCYNPRDGKAYTKVLFIVTITAPEPVTSAIFQVPAINQGQSPQGFHSTFAPKDGEDPSLTLEGYWGPNVGFPMSAPYDAGTDFQFVFNQSAPIGTYEITVELVDLDNENAVLADATASFELVRQPSTARWEPTGTVGIAPHGKLYQEFSAFSGEVPISLKEGVVGSITRVEPDYEVLEPNTDENLWFNVERAADDYVFEIIAEDDNLYQATLHWPGAQNASPSEPVVYYNPGSKQYFLGWSLSAEDGTLLDLSNCQIYRRKSAGGSFEEFTLPEDSAGLLRLTRGDYGYFYYFYNSISNEWYKLNMPAIDDTKGPIAERVKPEDGIWNTVDPIEVRIVDEKSAVVDEVLGYLADADGEVIAFVSDSVFDADPLDPKVRTATLELLLNPHQEYAEQSYELVLVTFDELANYRENRLPIFVEIGGPELTLTPINGQLQIYAKSSYGLKNVQIQVNEEDPEVEELDGALEYTDVFDLPAELAGTYEITVTVTDINDKSATDTYEYGVEGPELNVNIEGNQLSLAASSEVGLSRIEIRLDDEVVLDEALEGDEDSVAFELPTEVGEYRIKITVWDYEGVPTVWEYTYIVAPDQEAPKIVSMDITEGILTVVVTDNQGLDKVVVYIDGVPYAEAEVSGLEDTAVFELPDDIGTKEVKAEVYDLAGNNDCKSIIGRVRPDSRSGKSDGFGWEMWKN